MSIGVVILSYNRPELLRKAVASCADAAEVVVMDDGSPQFHIHEFVRDVRPDATLVLGRKRTPREHMEDLNFGRFLAAGTALLTTPKVAYLCDDDTFAEGWLKKADEYLEEHYVVVGEVVASNGRAFPSLSEGHFCLGNFALRTPLAQWENISWSPENDLWQDVGHLRHKVDDVALLALQHENNLSSYREMGKAEAYYR